MHEVGDLRRALLDAVARPWTAIEVVARSHAITEDARALLVKGDAEGFVAARRMSLDQLEESLLLSYRQTLDAI